VTGKYDIRMVEEIKELKDKVDALGLETDTTQLAHIFDESTNQDIEPGSPKVFPSFFKNLCITLDNDYLLAELCCLDVGGHASLWA
jgi:hypothetical protein